MLEKTFDIEKYDNYMAYFDRKSNIWWIYKSNFHKLSLLHVSYLNKIKIYRWSKKAHLFLPLDILEKKLLNS